LTHYCGRLGRVPPQGPALLIWLADSTAVAFLWISFEPGARVPNSLRHRIVTADAEGEGATIRTHHDELKHWGRSWKGRIGAPPMGKQRSGQPSRRGVLVFDGRPQISRRYPSTGWRKRMACCSQATSTRIKLTTRTGKPVLAVADATVLTHETVFQTMYLLSQRAVPLRNPITIETVSGKHDHTQPRGGQFAHLRTLAAWESSREDRRPCASGASDCPNRCSGDARGRISISRSRPRQRGL